jgi:hypothetical protein
MAYNKINYSRTPGAMCGRLVSVASDPTLASGYNPANPRAQNQLRGAVAIDFPAVPDDIVLKRSAIYNETPTIYHPDGIHQFMGVHPLHIEFTFRLHYADSTYCREGPYTILAVASRLHAMILPIVTGQSNQYQLNNYAAAVAGYSGSKDEAALQDRARATVSTLGANLATTISRPTTCQLELLDTGSARPGILCRGYVKDVSVRLIGPFLRGRGDIFNLPTGGEFSFTFVHVPGYANKGVTDLNGGFQAYAKTVRDRLFNTRDLIEGSARSYQGIEDVPDPTSSSTQQQQTTLPAQVAYDVVAGPLTIDANAYNPREVGEPLQLGTPYSPPAVIGAGPTSTPAAGATGGIPPWAQVRSP